MRTDDEGGKGGGGGDRGGDEDIMAEYDRLEKSESDHGAEPAPGGNPMRFFVLSKGSLDECVCNAVLIFIAIH